MTTDRFEVKIWGARGTLSVSGPEFAVFGGNTICIEVRCGRHVLIFDAGSGLDPAGRALLGEGQRDFHLFFTHVHYDHIMGLPFFLPLYTPDAAVTFWAAPLNDITGTSDMICDFMRRPFFPVGPEVFRGKIAMRDFQPGDALEPCPGVTVETALLSHPGGAVGYRISYAGHSVAMVFDTDHTPGTLDPAVLRLIDGTDLFLYDATFNDAEFQVYRFFGHSTWEHAVRLAEAAKALRVGMLHHATFRTDAQLLAIEAAAQRRFAGAFCARELQMIPILPDGAP